MSSAKSKYDKEDVLFAIAEYFFRNEKNQNLLNYSLKQVYADVIKYASESFTYRNVKFPKYSQMRKFLIDELSDYNKYSTGERLTTAVACKITEIYKYYQSDTIEDIIHSNNYKVSLYSNSVIVCTLKLPPTEILNSLAEAISKEKQKSISWARIYLIFQVCKKIKRKNPNVILAVIPQYNRMIYLNSNGKIDKHINDINPLCDTLCMFVKDTPEGKNFINEIKIHTFP